MAKVSVRHTSPDTGNIDNGSGDNRHDFTKHHRTGPEQSADSGSTVGQFGNKYNYLNRPAKMGIQKTKVNSGEEKMPNLKIALLTLLALAIFAGIMLATSPKQTIIINGIDNKVYTGIINDLYNSPDPDSLAQSNPDRFSWAIDYMDEFDNINLVGDPSAQTAIFFYELAKNSGKKFFINNKELLPGSPNCSF